MAYSVVVYDDGTSEYVQDSFMSLGTRYFNPGTGKSGNVTYSTP